MSKIGELINQLTLEEKVKLVAGHNSWTTFKIDRLNIDSIYLTDGPIGVRKKDDSKGQGSLGLSDSCVATSFPTSVNIACSWNIENAFNMGNAIGKECEAYDVNVILGPALNIKRDPRCGRNFEYYSEDPLLSGTIAGHFVNGVQSNNVAACIKHYALNNSENFRYMGDSICDVRAIREIYLKSFEQCIKIGHPKTAMCGYNKVNNIHCSESSWLINVMLRKTLGFEGVVMTDWGATKDRVLGIKAGIDLDMPGDVKHNELEIIKAINNNTLTMQELDTAVTNILKLVFSFNKNQVYSIEEKETLFKKHQQVALDIALDSAVLLKNDNNILPLKKNEKVLVVGELFEKMRYQGAGSSCMNPYHLTSPKQAFDDANVNYEYVKGYKEIEDQVNDILEQDALLKAKENDIILFFGGLTELFESEGYDRKDLKIPNNQISLINKLSNTNKVVLVLFGGSPIEIPNVDNVKAILSMFLPGQEGGKATQMLLYGKANPSGKLCETWMKNTSNIYRSDEFSSKYIEKYKENIYVGYRYFDEVKEKILYPFGYGLSYSSFNYKNIKVTQKENTIDVSFIVENTSNIDGKEIVQLYVGKNNNSKVFKAQKELKAFKKVFIKANSFKEVTLSINVSDLAYFNTLVNDFVVENGTYPIYVCSSSQKIELEGKVVISNQNEYDSPYSDIVINAYNNIKSEEITDEIFKETVSGLSLSEPSKLPFTLETSLEDFNQTRWGRFVLKLILKIVSGKTKVPKNEKDEAKIEQIIKNNRFTLTLIPRNSLRSLCQSSGGILQYNLANALLYIANGKPFKGIGYVFKKEK